MWGHGNKKVSTHTDTRERKQWAGLDVWLWELGERVHGKGWQAAAAPPSVSLHLTLNDTDWVRKTDKGKKNKQQDIRWMNSGRSCTRQEKILKTMNSHNFFFLLGPNSLHALTVHVSCDKVCVLTGHCDIKLSTASIYKGSMRQRLCTHVIHSRNSALINRNKH